MNTEIIRARLLAARAPGDSTAGAETEATVRKQVVWIRLVCHCLTCSAHDACVVRRSCLLAKDTLLHVLSCSHNTAQSSPHPAGAERPPSGRTPPTDRTPPTPQRPASACPFPGCTALRTVLWCWLSTVDQEQSGSPLPWHSSPPSSVNSNPAMPPSSAPDPTPAQQSSEQPPATGPADGVASTASPSRPEDAARTGQLTPFSLSPRTSDLAHHLHPQQQQQQQHSHDSPLLMSLYAVQRAFPPSTLTSDSDDISLTSDVLPHTLIDVARFCQWLINGLARLPFTLLLTEQLGSPQSGHDPADPGPGGTRQAHGAAAERSPQGVAASTPHRQRAPPAPAAAPAPVLPGALELLAQSLERVSLAAAPGPAGAEPGAASTLGVSAGTGVDSQPSSVGELSELPEDSAALWNHMLGCHCSTFPLDPLVWGPPAPTESESTSSASKGSGQAPRSGSTTSKGSGRRSGSAASNGSGSGSGSAGSSPPSCPQPGTPTQSGLQRGGAVEAGAAATDVVAPLPGPTAPPSVAPETSSSDSAERRGHQAAAAAVADDFSPQQPCCNNRFCHSAKWILMHRLTCRVSCMLCNYICRDYSSSAAGQDYFLDPLSDDEITDQDIFEETGQDLGPALASLVL